MDKPVDPAMACGLAQCLGQQLDRDTFSDFIIRVDERDFKCHRVVLSACSDFFAALLRSDMKENADGVARVEGIKAETFGHVLDSVYKGINCLTMDNVFDIWCAADQLQIEFLSKACEEFVIQNISEQNYLEILKHATLLRSTKVLHAVRQMIVQNFETIMFCDNFSELPAEELIAISNSYDLKVCADGLVQAILRWVSGRNYDGYLRDLGTPAESVHGEVDSSAQATPAISCDQIKAQDESNTEEIQTLSKSREMQLGRLFTSPRIGSMSNECLSLLLTHDIVMGCNEALRAVVGIAASRLNPVVRAQKRDFTTYQQKQCSSGKCSLHLHGPIIASFTFARH